MPATCFDCKEFLVNRLPGPLKFHNKPDYLPGGIGFDFNDIIAVKPVNTGLCNKEGSLLIRQD
jgi:hypothetical protein